MNPEKDYDYCDYNTVLRPDLTDDEISQAKIGITFQFIGFMVICYSIAGIQGLMCFMAGMTISWYAFHVQSDIPRIKKIQEHFNLEDE
jgi:hypothetical protein